MTLNKKKEIIKGLLLIAVLIFFIWGLILTINEDFIYADGTVHVKEASQYITADTVRELIRYTHMIRPECVCTLFFY